MKPKKQRIGKWNNNNKNWILTSMAFGKKKLNETKSLENETITWEAERTMQI